MADRQILSFDQALANTGWAVLSVGEGGFTVLGQGLLTTPARHDGHVGTIDRATKVYSLYRAMIESWPDVSVVVYELPPVNKVYRPESSLVAASALAIAHSESGSKVPLVAVQGQRMKKFLTGNAQATKRDVAAALASRKDLAMLGGNGSNEHVRDAIGLAITWEKCYDGAS